MNPPLQGIRIVEFEGLGPGPLAGRMLADMGAEVTVIARRQRTAVADQLGGSKPSPLRRGKTIVALDLKQPDDLAEALYVLLRDYEEAQTINVGTGADVTIRELSELMAETVGFAGKLVFDESKPDGTPRKVLDVSRIKALGWSPQIDLREGLRRTYAWAMTRGAFDPASELMGSAR